MFCGFLLRGGRGLIEITSSVHRARVSFAKFARYDELLTFSRSLNLTSLLQIDDLKIIGSTSLALGVATDIVTAASLCWFLQGLRTGYSKCVHSPFVSILETDTAQR